MHRRGLRNGVWCGPFSVTFLRDWGHRFWFGRPLEHSMGVQRGGWVVMLPRTRVQVGGPQPWRWPSNRLGFYKHGGWS